MKKLLLYLTLFILTVWAGIIMQLNQGYVVISYQHTTISMTLWAACLVIITLLILLRIMLVIWQKKHQVHRWLNERKYHKSRQLFKTLVYKGTCDMLEKKWRRASKHFSKAYAMEKHLFLLLSRR